MEKDILTAWNIGQKTIKKGGGKNLELSFLHIGTSTYTRVLCAIKTVPSGRKKNYFWETPLKGYQW